MARDGASRCGRLCSVLMFLCVLLLAVSRDDASRCGLLYSVLMFLCTVIGCVQGRRQSLWTAVFSVDVYVCCYWLWPGTAPVAVDCCVLC